MSNIKDVARECGVSIATVSRAFTKNSRISPDTREAVLECAAKLGYSPNFMARGLKTARSQTVGIIVPSVENYFYIGELKQLERRLRENGYRLIVSFMQHGVTSERDALVTMAGSNVDALIFTPRTSENSELVSSMSRDIKLFQLFSDVYDELDSIVMDDAGGVREATGMLLDAGHRRILYLGSDPRVSGYREAFDARSLSADERLISLDWELTAEKAVDMLRRLSPTAVIAIARLAETAWGAVIKTGLSVPCELSFIAYDDISWMRMFGITAVAHPLDEVADILIPLVIDRVEGKSSVPPVKHVIEPYIERRASVSEPAKHTDNA